ncbi:hypothetical protein BC835DRAFT_1409976 [Cytidiella melzeri]|nr:hypothetical protein BC835DRAFT_1409976 [Cytidiella melzeri]
METDIKDELKSETGNNAEGILEAGYEEVRELKPEVAEDKEAAATNVTAAQDDQTERPRRGKSSE